MQLGKFGKTRGKWMSIIVMLLFVSACSTIDTIHVKNAGELKDYGYTYCLPRSVVTIEIDLEKTTLQKGPYADFAEKFLSIENVITETTSTWIMSDIRISSYLEPDDQQYFLLQQRGKCNPLSLQFSAEGFLAGINAGHLSGESNYTSYNKLETPPKSPHIFTDLSVKHNFKEVKKTTYKEVITDSTYKKVPVYHTDSKQKTLEEKAEEAANFIIKLRKRRFSLLVGISDVKAPEGEGIKYMISELNALEQKYLELFTGVQIVEKETFRNEFTPNESNNGKKIVLCKFSEDAGIIDAEKNEGSPIILHISKAGNLNQVKALYDSQEKLGSIKGIAHRIPELSNVEILKDSTIIFSTKTLIPQYGTVSKIPSKTAVSKNFSVDFNSKTGAISGISNR